MKTKRCAACTEHKPLEEFNRLTKSKDGRQSYCRPCAHGKVKKWSADNRNHVYEYNEQYRKANPEKSKAWQKQYHRNWYLNNRDTKLQQNAEWAKAHPEYVARKNARRRGKRTIDLERIDWEYLKSRDIECYLCDEVIDYSLKWPDPGSHSLDHKIPLSLGGDHVVENLAFTHLVCNLRKGYTVIEDV